MNIGKICFSCLGDFLLLRVASRLENGVGGFEADWRCDNCKAAGKLTVVAYLRWQARPIELLDESSVVVNALSLHHAI